jgi:hypothetical protein
MLLHRPSLRKLQRLGVERLIYLSSTYFPWLCTLIETKRSGSNAGVMVGTGASATNGISKSSVEEWEQEVRPNLNFCLNSLSNRVGRIVQSQCHRPSILHDSADPASGEEQREESNQYHIHARRPPLHRGESHSPFLILLRHQSCSDNGKCKIPLRVSFFVYPFYFNVPAN